MERGFRHRWPVRNAGAGEEYELAGQAERLTAWHQCAWETVVFHRKSMKEPPEHLEKRQRRGQARRQFDLPALPLWRSRRRR